MNELYQCAGLCPSLGPYTPLTVLAVAGKDQVAAWISIVWLVVLVIVVLLKGVGIGKRIARLDTPSDVIRSFYTVLFVSLSVFALGLTLVFMFSEKLHGALVNGVANSGGNVSSGSMDGRGSGGAQTPKPAK